VQWHSSSLLLSDAKGLSTGSAAATVALALNLSASAFCFDGIGALFLETALNWARITRPWQCCISF